VPARIGFPLDPWQFGKDTNGNIVLVPRFIIRWGGFQPVYNWHFAT
jgi:hypothetical protein